MSNIYVSEEKLNEYCSTVAGFQFGILQELYALMTEAEKLSSSMDQESSQAILQTVRDITQILSDHQEKLNIHALNVKSGSIPASSPPSAYWISEEGQKVSKTIGNVIYGLFEKACNASDPTDNCSEAFCSFLQISMPFLADSAEKMMALSYEQFTPSTMQQFNRTFIMKDQDGNYVTAAQAGQNALSCMNTAIQSALGKAKGTKKWP